MHSQYLRGLVQIIPVPGSVRVSTLNPSEHGPSLPSFLLLRSRCLIEMNRVHVLLVVALEHVDSADVPVQRELEDGVEAILGTIDG